MWGERGYFQVREGMECVRGGDKGGHGGEATCPTSSSSGAAFKVRLSSILIATGLCSGRGASHGTTEQIGGRGTELKCMQKEQLRDVHAPG